MSVRVFIGTDPNGCDAESLMVLEYTLRKHSSEPLDIVFMRHSHDPESFWHGWDASRWATPFSGFRWGIPAACGFAGRAIYMDSDMIVRADIAELWHMPIEPGKVALAKGNWRFCVTLFDCAAARDAMLPIERLKAPDGHSAQSAVFKEKRHLVQAFDPNWNYCDLDDQGPIEAAKILHYTDMSTQPHLRYALPRLAASGQKHWFDGTVRTHPRAEIVDLFDREYQAALDAGYSVSDYVPSALYGELRKASLKNYRKSAA